MMLIKSYRQRIEELTIDQRRARELWVLDRAYMDRLEAEVDRLKSLIS